MSVEDFKKVYFPREEDEREQKDQQEQRQKRMNESKMLREASKKIVDDRSMNQINRMQILVSYLIDCKKRYKEGDLLVEELGVIRKIIEGQREISITDINFFVASCTRFNNYGTAISFLNKLTSPSLSENSKEKLIQELKQLEKSSKAIKLYQEGYCGSQLTSSEIANEVGMREVDVIYIIKEFNARKKATKEQEQEIGG